VKWPFSLDRCRPPRKNNPDSRRDSVVRAAHTAETVDTAMSATGRYNGGKWAWTAVVVGLNLALWILPSRVSYLIAQNRDVLLGRYSVERVTALLILGPISAVSLFLTWSDPSKKKRRQFAVAAVALSLLAGVAVVDTAARLGRSHGYIVRYDFLSRLPNRVNHGVHEDVPSKAFLYPTNPPAYPDIEYTLTTDARGFRNRTDYDHYDVVAIGDSFVEGSNVSDEQVWPVLLAEKTGRSIYNLGMSAGNCVTYHESLKRIGVGLSPRIVLCMVYEGNDFRDSNYRNRDAPTRRVGRYFRASPIRLAVKAAVTRGLGGRTVDPPDADDADATVDEIREDRARAGADDPVSWLPAPVGPEDSPRYYAFKIKDLLSHFVTAERFEQSAGCVKTLEKLGEIKQLCDDHGSHLTIVYAPSKYRTLTPLLMDRLTDSQLHAFMSLKADDLPEPERLKEVLAGRLDVMESAIKYFCETRSIGFVSLVEPLREAMAQGRQAYFTYDQHWTPIGHEIVAEVLAAYLGGSDAEGPACDEGE